MQKGIVFEINNKKATIMKNNGDFICVNALAGWQKGDVVTIKAQTVPYIFLVRIAACVLLFISIPTWGYNIYFEETALISLDVNPSIELSVNRFDRIIDVRSLNDSGYDILEKAKVKNQSLDHAITTLFNSGLGDFISTNPLVTFTVFSDNTQNEQQLLSRVQDTADDYITAHHSGANVEVLSVDEDMVNHAHEYNVTAGKYAALLELQGVAPEIEIENYSHHSIFYIKEQIKVHGDNHEDNGEHTQEHE